MKRLLDWLDHRTGVKKLTHEVLYENVPGGARWRYVWGSTLTFAIFVQFITGVFLWMAYSPSSQTAWESVYYIQHQMTGGWLLRGIHHFTAHAMIILLALHLMQVLIDGAYKAPREVNFWTGLVLLVLVLALSLTGYLLPWDQKGFWATKVTTNIVGISPMIGPAMQKLIVGGADYGHHTLTRFFALHAGVLPGLIVAVVVGHIYLFRRHGLTPKQPLRRRDAAFWPDQVLKDTVACLGVLAAVLFLIVRPRLFSADAPLGAELGAPADGSEAYSAARPEWYFLFLFQFLKYFPGESEVWGAIVIPSLAMVGIFLMPFLGQWKLGHRFNIGSLCALLLGAGLLTYLAYAQDRADPSYQLAVRQADQNAERVVTLARARGIPPTGALELLRDDPLTQGPKLFAKNCASCHRFDGHDSRGEVPTETHEIRTGETLAGIASTNQMTVQALRDLNPRLGDKLVPGEKLAVHPPPTAADLKGFANRDWIAGLLDSDRIVSAHYFGGTKFKDGRMARYVTKDVARFTPAQKEQLKEVIVALSAEAGLKSQAEPDRRDGAVIEKGRQRMTNDEMRCTECHQFHKPDEDATGPDLTGYGSREWLVSFISDPAHTRYYGKRNDRMPAFAQNQRLTPHSIELIVDWLRGDWHESPKDTLK
ncbi:MAG: c-type cytochrome [Pedosphaera sp.]|nr:c-type cytochrome [Pedosphaera sp.]